MEILGTISKKLENFLVPTCSSCLYAKVTKRICRSRKLDSTDEARKPTKPGECVSVDKLVSLTPGLVTQMIEFLKMNCYKYVTIYVDQASRILLVYLQNTATSEDTLKGKYQFELYAKYRGVYHADNGIFKSHKWVMEYLVKGKSLTFVGVNSHHMNRISEKNQDPSINRDNNAYSRQQKMAKSIHQHFVVLRSQNGKLYVD